MKTLDRKLRRDLRGALGRILAILSIIAIGVAGYVEMRSCYNNLSSAKDRYYAQCRMADFSVEVKKAPLSDLAAIARMPDVVELRPRIVFFATVDLEGEPELLNAQVLSLPDERKAAVNDIVLKRGSYFSASRDNEVIVSDAFARQHRLGPGQWIHLIMNNRRQELFIVGTAISSEFVYLVGPGAITPDPKHFGVFYLKQRYAEEVFNFEGAANQVVVRVSPEAQEHVDGLMRRVETLLADYGVMSTTARKNQASNRFISEEIEGLNTFSRIMPTIFLVVAALVLNVLMTRMAEQQRTVIGTLKAIGYGDGQLFWHFIKFGLFIGVIGGVVGSILGYFLAGWLTGIYTKFYEFPDLSNRLYPGLMLEGLAISVTCAVGGTIYGARSVLKLNPASAMRPKPPAQGKQIFIERVAWLWRQLGSGWRTVLRGLFRNRFRTVAGMTAAALGTAILVTGLMMRESMDYLIEFQFNRIQRSDIELHFKDERGIDALSEAKNLPGVDHAEPILEVVCTFTNGPYRRRGAVTGLLRGARLTIPRDETGAPVRLAPVGLTMTRMLADILHLRVGDEVTIRPIRGERRDLVAPISAITDTFLGLSVYADFHYLNSLVGEEYAVSGVQLATDKSPSVQRALHKELKDLPAIQAVASRAHMIQNLNETVIDTQKTFIGVLIAFAGIIFFGSVLNNSLISLAERQREVATFRVLGYTPWQIGGLFFRETAVVNAAGTLLGLPLGYVLSLGITEAYNNELFRIAVHTPPRLWAITLALAVAFTIIAHGFVQWAILKMDWLDALKVKE
ncbi:MAG: ABC transporter permease [Pirellulales bacterium]